MKGFFKDATGKQSMARLQIFIGSLVGVFMVVYGAFTKQDYLVYAGIGLITVEGGVKAVQKAGEK
jgi:hypothetical protein